MGDVADEQGRALLSGLEAYRAGHYFEAHERWEGPWRKERDPDRRRLLQALVQIAAAMHKLLAMGDAPSAVRILARAAGHVRGVAEGTLGVRVGALSNEIARASDAIERLDAGRAPGLEPPSIEIDEPDRAAAPDELRGPLALTRANGGAKGLRGAPTAGRQESAMTTSAPSGPTPAEHR